MNYSQNIIDLFNFIISTLAPWGVSIILLGLIILTLFSLPTIIKAAAKLSIKTRVGLLIILCLGIFVRFFWVPDGHRIYYDEDRYLTYTTNFAKHGKALNIIFSTKDKIILGDPDPAARVTVPTINAWIYKIFGYKEKNLFIAARIFSVIQIILAFSLVMLLFGSEIAALFTALAIALIPTIVYWSVSTNIDLYFVSFSLLTFIATKLYSDKINFPRSLFLMLSLILLLFVRFESFLFLPVIISLIVIKRIESKQKLIIKQDLPTLAILLPIIICRALISSPVFSQVWCCAEATPLEVFSFDYFFRNTIPNLLNLFNRPEFPFILTILAIYAVFSNKISTINKTYIIPILVWIILFFFIYSFYYAGLFYDVSFSGSYGRFFLMLIPPITILASLTIHQLVWHFTHGTIKIKNLVLGSVGLILISLIPTISNYRQFVTISPWDEIVEETPRINHQFIEEVILPQTPDDAIMIMVLTSITHAQGRTSILFEPFLTNDLIINYVKDSLKDNKRAFIINTNTCSIFPERCAKINKIFDFVPFKLVDPKLIGIEILEVKLKEGTK